MKIGILFSCQYRLLADAVRAALPHAEVLDFEAGPLLDPSLRQPVVTALRGCDHILAIPTPPEYGALATQEMEGWAASLTLVPSFAFAGFHPDMAYIMTAQGFLDGPTHHYHSRIAMAGYLTGRTVRQTMGLYNALVFGRCGYFEIFAVERRMVVDLYAQFGMAIDPFFDRWMQRGCFMHSVNHPVGWAYADLGLAICRRAGLIGVDVTIDPDLIGDDLLQNAAHPLLPPLARRLGLVGSTSFTPGQPSAIRHLGLEQFLEHEYATFAQASRAELEAVPVMSTVLACLG